MRIRLKLGVINIQLKIKGWHICADDEDLYDNWCSLELYLSELMDYHSALPLKGGQRRFLKTSDLLRDIPLSVHKCRCVLRSRNRKLLLVRNL